MNLKKLMVMLTLFLSLLVLEADPKTETKHLAIQGGLGSVMYVDVHPIASQSQYYIMGMPFSVEDDLVDFNYGRYGRLVANISMLANSRFKIKVSAPDLSWIKNDSYEEESWNLPYILTFECDVSYYLVNSVTPINDNFIFAVKSVSANDTKPQSHSKVEIAPAGGDVSLFNDNVDYDSLVGNAEGRVYFKFAQNADIVKAPGGDYIADVIIELEPVE